MSASSGIPGLRVSGFRKTFGGAVALDGLDLEVRAGEVHALLGQNGSGKSTLVKALTGVHSPDAGSAQVFGEELRFPVVRAHEHGIAVVHQDLGFLESLTVLENLGANASYGARLLEPVRERSERAIYTELMERFEVHVSLDVPMSEVPPAERAMLGIVRALRVLKSGEGRQVFILDEPTAALSSGEAEVVLALMRRVANSGSAVVFISHRLNEVLAVCDSVTVLRDGRAAFTAPITGLERAQLVEEMLGKRLAEVPGPSPLPIGAPARLVISQLSGVVVSGLDVTVHGGEIVGITGLAGMGQEELPPLLAGTRDRQRGEVSIDGNPLGVRPRDVINQGLVVVPGNRLRDGCWPSGSALENVTMPVLKSFVGRFGLSARRERQAAASLLERSGLRPLDPDRTMTGFSGGNQQKVVFAKWLQLEPKVMVLDEPTQGVDVGAAQELLGQVTRAAAGGAAVLLCSGDHEQLVETCHRVLVLNAGRVVAELQRDSLSEQAILEAAS